MEDTPSSGRPLLRAVLAILFVAIVGALVFSASRETLPPVKVVWLIAHEPVSLFDRASKVLVDEFNARGDRTMELQVLGPSDVDAAAPGVLSGARVFEELDAGRVHMASVSVGALAQNYPKLMVISLPFLFDDYGSAERVFDGAIGRDLLEGVSAHTSVRGLGFTFSGGFMVIESNTRPMGSAESLEGLRIATINGRMSQNTLAAFGAKPEVIDGSGGAVAAAAALDSYDGMELPYTRIVTEVGQKPKYVYETNHSLFTTAIIASDAFYDSLSARDQIALQQAIAAAAKAEREDSIAYGLSHKADLEASGTKIVALDSSDAETLKALSTSVYRQYEQTQGGDFLERIQAQR